MRRGGVAVAANVVLGFFLDGSELCEDTPVSDLARENSTRTRASLDVPLPEFRDQPPTWPWKPLWEVGLGEWRTCVNATARNGRVQAVDELF